MSIDPKDPRLTAYALGELDEVEAAEIQRRLKSDPAARENVKQIRRAADRLARALEAEPANRLTGA